MIPSFGKNSISTSTLKSKWIQYHCPITVYCGFFTVVLIMTKQNPLNPSKTDRSGMFSFLGNRCYYWIGEKLFQGRTENRSLSSVVPVAQEAICRSSPWSGWDLLHAHAGKSIFRGQGWNTSDFLFCVRGSSVFMNVQCFTGSWSHNLVWHSVAQSYAEMPDQAIVAEENWDLDILTLEWINP